MKMYLWFLLALLFVFGIIFAYKNDFDLALVRHEALMHLAELRNDASEKDDELGQAFDALLGEARETRDQIDDRAAEEQSEWKTELDNLVAELESKKEEFGKIKNDIDGRVTEAKEGYEEAKEALESFRAAFASIKDGMSGATNAIDGFRNALAE